MRRWLLLLVCLVSYTVQADLRAVSTVTLPVMMPVNNAVTTHSESLRVGLLDGNSAPWVMRVGNELYGIEADVLAALPQLTGVKLRLSLYATPERLKTALQHGDIDFALATLPDPLPVGMLPSESLFSSPLRIYRNQQNSHAVMFNSQDARRAVSKATLAQLPAVLRNGHQWRIHDNDLQAFSGLLNQQNDYVVADEISAGFLLSQLQQGQIYQLTSDVEGTQTTLRAFARDAATIDWLNQSLHQLPAEWMNNLQSRWGASVPRLQDKQTLMLSMAERAWIRAHPVIYYAAETDNAPWSYRDSNGVARGYSIDLLNAVAGSSGLRFEPRWVSNPQQGEALLAQRQVMLQLNQPLSDATLRNATLPVWRALWGIYSIRPTAISQWSDIDGKRVGILRNDLAAQLLPAGTTPRFFSDRASLYHALVSGQIDVLADNVLSARWYIASHAGDSIHLAFAASDIAWPVAFNVQPDQTPLRALFNRALQQIPADTQQQLRDRWLMPPQPANARMMRSLPLMLLVAAGVAIVILLVLLARRYFQQRRERLQRQEAERANAMKSQFLATVSHELRTPMQAILGLLELEKKTSANLALAHSSARSLMTLLNDLQDHARIENHSFTLVPRPLSLRQWLARQQQFYAPLLREEGPVMKIEALTPLPQTIRIDADRLQQVINNLMTNALKFTRQGTIALQVSVSDRLVITVSDSGNGIPPEEQQRLFDPWYQAPSGRSVSIQGSGLGLFICREIVQRMGGTILLHSLPREGTTVTVTLPLDLCEQTVSEDAALPRCPHLRVAVVDDHPANLLVMQQQLARFAIEADCFADGRALLRADFAQPYDLLFIDQMMPRPDGKLLLRLLRRRARQRGRRALRILCSADVPQPGALSDENESMLMKPVQLADIAALLNQYSSDALAPFEENLSRLAGGNEKYLLRLCQTLRDALTGDMAHIMRAREEKNWAQLMESAHRMKGSWLLIGLEEGAAVSQRLAEKAKQHQDLSEETDLLLSLTNRLLERLDTYGSHSLP